MGSVATEHPEPITAIFTGPGIIWSKKAFKATVLLHYIVDVLTGVKSERHASKYRVANHISKAVCIT